MTADECFLQAIIDNPDDDTLRLVYADWLEERGDPRGEFVRVQCELAGMTEDDARRPDLQARERELLAEHEDQWVKTLRPWLTLWTFQRGFVEHVAFPPQVYLEHADDLHRLAPVRRVEIDLTRAELPQAAIDFLPESIARENGVLLLGQRGRKLELAMRDPHDADSLQRLQFILNRDIEPIYAPAEQILGAIERHYGRTSGLEVVTTCCFGEDAILFEPLEDHGSPVARLVDLIIQEAHMLRATEIYVDPQEDCLVVRYRIDGKMVERDTPPRRLLDPMVDRIRSVAEMEDDQRGSIRRVIAGTAFDLKVNISPTPRGPCIRFTL